jgi:tripeptide aminopeptidase
VNGFFIDDKEFKMNLIDRFVRYVKIDTQSDADSSTVPSTSKQFDLLHLLKQELIDLGVKEIRLESSGILYATISANSKSKAPSIGLMAHVDTASEMSGKNVKPNILKNYNGDIITLNREQNIYLDPKIFPSLKKHKGKTIVTTDGTTLLGADDKAGIAIIMTLIQHLKDHPEILHGPIQIGFTSDEEIGRGVVHFDPKLFQADFAYTLDGGPVEEINYENFNASSAIVTVQGKAIHPGSAKGQMINSQTLAAEFHLSLPKDLKPETTDGYQGFIHLTQSSGSVEKTELRYIIRHHDLKALKKQENLMIEITNKMNKTLKQKLIHIDIKASYFNMAPAIKKQPEGLNRALKAYQSLGLTVKPVPIRGGTDGANLTFKGVPTPNLATGGENYHGKYEFLVVEDAELMVKVLTEIVRIKV